MLGIIVGIALGYFFKPQIDNLVGKIRNKSKNNDNWDN
jgi:hypothetical protein